MFEVTIEETFSAGHALRNYRGKCENVHGHNYRCRVTVEGGELDEIGQHAGLIQLLAAHQHLHAVIMPVHVLALPPVIPQGVPGRKCMFYRNFKHRKTSPRP